MTYRARKYFKGDQMYPAFSNSVPWYPRGSRELASGQGEGELQLTGKTLGLPTPFQPEH